LSKLEPRKKEKTILKITSMIILITVKKNIDSTKTGALALILKLLPETTTKRELAKTIQPILISYLVIN